MAEFLSTPSLPTFRDPSGYVELRSDGAYRTIRAPHDEPMREFLASPLAEKLVAEGRLIDSEQVSASGEEYVLRHPRVWFQSYPWEWAPSMWAAAAKLTLTLGYELVEQGWQLKDATPLNILFRGGRPVLVDVGSVERRDTKQTVWLAYGQFVRTFLLPMLAHTRLGWPLAATMTRRDGFEPEEIYAALGWRGRLRQPALSAVTLPALLAKKVKSSGAASARPMADPEVSRHVALRALKGLESQIKRVTPPQRVSTWSDYAATATHYSDQDHERKRQFVRESLGSNPGRVLDVGCNTGVYSMLAAEAGADVVAIDTDAQAVDRLWLRTHADAAGTKILPLHVDLAFPTPATGWENHESASFLARTQESFDKVMMLAVIHHLLLSAQIPLDRIAALIVEITRRDLIIEWVPATDEKFREILRGRDEMYAHLTEEAFREAFNRHFAVVRVLKLENGRTMFHMRKDDGKG